MKTYTFPLPFSLPFFSVASVVPGPKTTEEMKERGNWEFKKGNFKDAIDFYTQAITQLVKKLPTNPLTVKGQYRPTVNSGDLPSVCMHIPIGAEQTVRSTIFICLFIFISCLD
jgi:hypothetical protein